MEHMEHMEHMEESSRATTEECDTGHDEDRCTSTTFSSGLEPSAGGYTEI